MKMHWRESNVVIEIQECRGKFRYCNHTKFGVYFRISKTELIVLYIEAALKFIQKHLITNKMPAKTFTPPAQKKIGTRWPFVEKVNE